MQTEIKHNWFYACPPQTVWDFLTTPELLSQWLMDNDIKPVAGHRFMFKTKALPAMEFDGNVYCEVLEVISLKKLSYTWKAGSGDGSLNLGTVVTWTLYTRDNGTELFGTYRFRGGDKYGYFQAMDTGWKKNMSEKMAQLITKKLTDETVRS
jgi:uncharacterized protein YndB with AHSA1/START domain